MSTAALRGLHDLIANLIHDTQPGGAERPPWLAKVLDYQIEHGWPEPTNKRQIVALSGGKDSTAMALALSFFEIGNYEFVITPTGDELPEMDAHWAKLEELIGMKLHVINPRTLMGLIVEQKALPNHRSRWCTRLLKLEPYYGWLGTVGEAISYVGLRADEESRPGMLFPDVGSVTMDFPMRRWGWTIEDVTTFLAFLGVTIPERTDCAVCFWQKLGEWYLLWRDHPDRYDRGVALEEYVTKARGVPYTLRSPERDSWPASLAELRAEFEKGRIPERSLKMMDRKRQIGACRACTL